MDGTRSRPQTAAAALVAAALAVGGIQLASGETAPVRQLSDSLPLPPTVVVDQVANRLLDGQPDDGLNRFIVTLRDPQAVADGVGSVPESADANGTVALGDADDPRYLQEPGLTDGDRALLEQIQGVGSRPAAASGFDIDDLMGIDGIHAVTPAGPGFAGVATTLGAAELAALDGVAGVDEDPLRMLAADYSSFQWALHNEEVPGADIRWDEARTRASGTGVVVAVIDSGVDLDHPDLADQWWTNPGEVCGNGVDDDANGYIDDCQGWDFANGDHTVEDNADNNHGTHVSGTIAATDDGEMVVGVAPGARIMPLKIFHNGASSSSRLAAAINYAVDNGADVINLSLGGDTGTPAEELALQRASDAGIPVIVASGNDGRNTDRTPSYPAAYDLPTLIAVGSTNADDTRSSFSNYGALSVDLFAPGGEILSTVPNGLAYMSGTSMAAPHAAGVAAMLVQNGVDGAAVRQQMMDSAKPLASLEGRSMTGARLDAAAALGMPRGGGGVPEITFTSFHDLAHWRADEAAVWVTADTRSLGVDDVIVRGTLGVVYEREGVYGVVDLPVTVHDGQVTTDDNAQFPLTSTSGLGPDQRNRLVDGLELPVGLTLPDGNYALAIELLDAADPSGPPLVPAGLVFFDVEESGLQAEDQVVNGDNPGDIDEVDGPAIDLPGSDGPTQSPDTDTGTSTGGDDPATADDPTEGTPVTVPGAPGINLGPGVPDADLDAPVDALPVDGLPADGLPVDDVPGDLPVDGLPAIPPVPEDDREDGQEDEPGLIDQILEDVQDAIGRPGVGNGRGPGKDDLPGVGHGRPGRPTDPVTDLIDDVLNPDPGTEGDESADEEIITGTVSPDRGAPDQGVVSITVPSGIPADAFIRFGGSNAPITSRISDTRVLVQPPPHTPGTVDVSVASDGQHRRMPGAYTYLTDDGEVPTPVVDEADPVIIEELPDVPDQDGTDDNDLPGVPNRGSDAPAVPAPTVGEPTEEPTEDGDSVSRPRPGTPSERGKFRYNGLWIDELATGNPLAGMDQRRPRQERCQTEVCAARSM